MPNNSANGRPAPFLGSMQLGRILHDLAPLGCLDIGARGGVTEDLLPLGKAAEIHGFEPDEIECERLNKELRQGDHPYGKVEFLPIALGAKKEQKVLNITRHRGASSLLAPDPAAKARFQNRAAYFKVERTAPVDTRPLDEVLAEHGVANAVYMKVDVEGFELDILKGAEALLASSLLAVRAEVALAATRLEQPDFGEISAFLKRFHFMPMGFLYLVDWRSLTKSGYPKRADGPIPYSRGQTIHGDALFLRDPERLDDDAETSARALLGLACLALLYDYADFAHDIVQRPTVQRFLDERHKDADMQAALGEASRFLEKCRRRRVRRQWRKDLVKVVKADLRRVVDAVS